MRSVKASNMAASGCRRQRFSGGPGSPVQVDIGFGDTVTPTAQELEFPSLLSAEGPRLRVYPRETVVAEKLQAIVVLGQANSRTKDFYDLLALSRRFAFEGGIAGPGNPSDI